MNVNQLIAEANKLSIDDLRTLNSGIVEICRRKQRAVAQNAGSKFTPGQLVSFVSSKGQNRGMTLYMRIKKFNRAGDCAQGPQCDKDGKEMPYATKWTVPFPMLTLVK